MKKGISCIIITVSLIACKSSKESLMNFDMSIFCKKYYVLIPPRSNSMYVFITKEDMNRRFVIFKDFNYLNSGYGYMYATIPDIKKALKNGLFKTADDAIRNAEEDLNKRSYYNLYLHNILPLNNSQWSAAGEILEDICPEK